MNINIKLHKNKKEGAIGFEPISIGLQSIIIAIILCKKNLIFILKVKHLKIRSNNTKNNNYLNNSS